MAVWGGKVHALHAMHAWFRYDGFMAMITIRDLDAEIKRGLRVRAAMNGRSMEAEARAILTAIVNYVPIAEMPGPEPAAPEKEQISGVPAARLEPGSRLSGSL
jgi:plasmid stability protein